MFHVEHLRYRILMGRPISAGSALDAVVGGEVFEEFENRFGVGLLGGFG